MKKIILVILVCSILGFVYQSCTITNQKRGDGTFSDPYYIQDINKIEELENIFEKDYLNMLKDSRIKYQDNTRMIWENSELSTDSHIYIESIEYIGNQTQADIMIIVTCNGIDKELKQDLITRLKDEEIMITTSFYPLDFNVNKDVDTSLFKQDNADAFSLRLADDILEDHAKMIMTYKIKDDDYWYSLTSLIDIDDPTFLKIPTKEYGQGEIK